MNGGNCGPEREDDYEGRHYCSNCSPGYTGPLCDCTFMLRHCRPRTKYDGKVMFSVCLFTRGGGRICSLVPGPFPTSGPRSWPGGGGEGRLSHVLGQGYPIPLPPPGPGLGGGRGGGKGYPSQVLAHTTDRICHSQYASCAHTGLSCY